MTSVGVYVRIQSMHEAIAAMRVIGRLCFVDVSNEMAVSMSIKAVPRGVVKAPLAQLGVSVSPDCTGTVCTTPDAAAVKVAAFGGVMRLAWHCIGWRIGPEMMVGGPKGVGGAIATV